MKLAELAALAVFCLGASGIAEAKKNPCPKPTPCHCPTPTPTPSPSPTPTSTADACPVPAGVQWNGEKRFFYGVNYAWKNFAGDFGGIPPWNIGGVAANLAAIDADFADMKANGASVIRWWMFPDFRGDAVQFDASGNPTGLGATVIKDLQAALALADKYDMYLQLDIFSFDNFRATTINSGILVRGLQPIILNPAQLKALLTNVIGPIAKAAEASPYKKRLISWDMINEPEWTLQGPSLYGDPDFSCNAGMQCLTHSQMESFLLQLEQTLKANSSALVTVGGAAVKWGKAWSGLNLDFYTFHTYDWVNQWYPYTNPPSFYGVPAGKPVVMGEYPMNGLTGVPVATMLSGFLVEGYGGAVGWSVTDAGFNWPTSKANLKAFATQNPCKTKY